MTKTLPLQTRLAQLQPGESTETVNLAWSTGAPVKRFDWWHEQEIIEELDLAGADLSRLNAGAPVLDTHGAWDLRSVIGVVERAWVADGEGRATIRLSNRPEVDGIRRDIADGILRNVSVGYRVDAVERIRHLDEPDLIRVTAFTPMEISIVPIPADAGAQVRRSGDLPEHPVSIHEDNPVMSDEKDDTQGPAADPAPLPVESDTPAPPDLDAIRAAAVAGERQRIAEITRACRAARLPEMADELISAGVTLDAARAAVIDQLAAKSGPELRHAPEPVAHDFEQLVTAAIAAGQTRGQAIRAVASAHPDLHRQYLARVNAAA